MKIIGHQFQLQYLLSQIQQKKLPHFFLFSGPEKVGKKTIAIFLSNTLLPNFSPSHPDFLMIKPEKDKISIDQIKQAIWFLSLKPSLGDYKIVIVDDAHLMTKDAQNCFLKTLEEPKGKTLIFLVSSLPSLLLSTIHSRAHKLKFTFVSKEEMENFLKEKGIKAKEREFILEIAKGRPGRMIEILNDKNLFQQYQNLKEMAEKFEKIPLSQRLELIKEISQKEEFLEFLTKKLEREVLSPFTQQRAISLLKLIQSFFYYFYAFKVDKQMALEILALQI